MSLSKFKIVKTSESFYYKNDLHALYDEKLEPLNREFDSKIFLPKSGLTKSSRPKTVKIVLGHGCNYSCGYCVQKDIGNPNERNKNSNLGLFIDQVTKNLDFNELERIELWGGETLLYWPDIVELMSKFDRENLNWYIPTNGTTLSPKHVEFFSKLKGKVSIGISHDGPAHTILRGPEFLNRKVEVLRQLQEAGISFSFNPVISLFNYDLFLVNDFFSNFLEQNSLKKVNLVFELGRVYDKTLTKNSFKHVIHGDHLKKYGSILKRYLAQHLQEIKKPETSRLLKTNLVHFGNGVLPFAITLKQQRPISFRSNCGVDLEDLITVDVNGQVRTCQNAGAEHVQGHLDDLAKIKFKGVDLTKNDFCKNCSVLRLCKSSCPIDISFDVFKINHDIEKIHYTEMLLNAFELLLGSEVEAVEENVSSSTQFQHLRSDADLLTV